MIEYCRFGELFDELINCTPSGWFSERETSQIIRQIAEALQYMHSKHIIHRDLKLENILISMKTSYSVQEFNNSRRRGESIDIFMKHSQTIEKNEENGFMNRRHSECIKAIPKDLLFGDDEEKQSSIIIKVSDFGLSRQMEMKLAEDDDGDDGIKAEDGYKKKMGLRLLSRQKKREKQFAAMATNCGTLYYVGMCLLDLVDMMRANFLFNSVTLTDDNVNFAHIFVSELC